MNKDIIILGLSYGRKYLLDEYKELEHRNDLNYFTMELLEQLHMVENELEELLKESYRDRL